MCGERETPHHHPVEPEVTAPRRLGSRLDPALAKLAHRRMMLGLQPPRPAAVRPSMHTLEPRFLMAGDVVYALNAGGVDFTDVNGIAWVNDTAFTNQDAANSSTASTSSLIDRNHPSVPLGTDLQLLQSERYDAATGEPMAYRLAVDNGSYQVDLYFADTFSGTQGIGDRVFDIQLEGVTVADDFDVVAAAGGGYRAYVETFTVAVSDGVLDLEFFHEIENPAIKGVLVRTVDVDPPDPVAPVVDLNGPAVGSDHAATFTPGQGPVPVTTSDALLSDADSTELASLTVSLDATPDGADESLSADTTGTGLTAAYLDGTLTITGVGTVAEYQDVLRSVAYDNTATDPDPADRTITVVANDGALDSTPVTSTIAINLTPPDPIAPVLDLNGPDLGTENATFGVACEGPFFIAPQGTLTDNDSATLASLTATIDTTFDGDAESLDADVSGTGITKSYSNGMLSLSGVASVADYQAVLRSITYDNVAEPVDTNIRFITVVANDGVLDSNPNLALVGLTNPEPDPDPVAPVLDLNGLDAGVNTTATFVVGEGPVSIVPPEALLTDGDSATLQSITVKIDPVPADAQQTLAADTTGTPITATYSSGKLTLTGTATVAEYQSVLRTITYDNASSDPDLTPRVVTFVASDGVLSSIGASAIVQIQNPVVEAGSVVYALNAGGNSFTDANG
ncbi:MAG: malectin domain-containing carbohydrate-binding protein, partial [Planctomycetota bacterium]